MKLRELASKHAAVHAVALAGLVAYPLDAMPAESVGEASKIINTVTGKIATNSRALNTADPVYAAEEISAGAESRGELLLSDGSRVIVGEGSTIHMDDFVVAGDSFAEGTISVAKGAFRFISGRSKDNISIKTPLSTIGIRGTVFDVYVGEAGVTRVVLLNGSITTCSDGQCVTSNRPCDVVEVNSPGTVQELPFLRSAGRRRGDEAEQFNLTEQQQRHTREWRAPTLACSARAADEAQTPGTAGPGNANGGPGPGGRGGNGPGDGDSGSETKG